MISSTFLLGLGILVAVGMVAWGMSGIILGKVITKSYGTVDGERRYYRFVRRDEEPIWFWILCSTYLGVGIAMMVLIYVFLEMPAISN
ncbi:MAG TPA: hypothetical protein VLV32_11065 [Burkholderiales bacterium]|nr:hypothetical protein [Burkholderiales bacterium]